MIQCPATDSRTLSCALLAGLILAASPARGHQTAAYEVAVGAELEILTRNDQLVVDAPASATRFERPDPGPGVLFEPYADAEALFLVHTLIAAAKATGSASFTAAGEPVSAHGFAGAGAFVLLTNLSEEPMEVELEVTLPGRTPDLEGTNEYRYEASTDENFVEYASIRFDVEVTGPDEIGNLPWQVISTRREVRDPVDLSEVDPGPGMIDAFGVPFTVNRTITLPPSLKTVETDSGIEVVIERYQLALFARVGGKATSNADPDSFTTEPIVFDPEFPFDFDAEFQPQETRSIPAMSVPGMALAALGVLLAMRRRARHR